MQTTQTFKFVLLPNPEQKSTIHKYAGGCRFVFNNGLALLNQWQQSPQSPFNYASLHSWVDELRGCQETSWLLEVPLFLLRHSINELISLYQNFLLKGADKPTFRKKGRTDAFHFFDDIELEPKQAKVRLPGIGWVSFQKDCELLGKLTQVTLVRESRTWFAEITTEIDSKEESPLLQASYQEIPSEKSVSGFCFRNEERNMKKLEQATQKLEELEKALKEGQKDYETLQKHVEDITQVKDSLNEIRQEQKVKAVREQRNIRQGNNDPKG